jgi:hypothetical protein
MVSDSFARPRLKEDGTTQPNRREAYFASPLAMYVSQMLVASRRQPVTGEPNGMRVAMYGSSFARSQFLEDDTTQPKRREAHLASPLAMYWRPYCIFCTRGRNRPC